MYIVSYLNWSPRKGKYNLTPAFQWWHRTHSIGTNLYVHKIRPGYLLLQIKGEWWENIILQLNYLVSRSWDMAFCVCTHIQLYYEWGCCKLSPPNYLQEFTCRPWHVECKALFQIRVKVRLSIITADNNNSDYSKCIAIVLFQRNYIILIQLNQILCFILSLKFFKSEHNMAAVQILPSLFFWWKTGGPHGKRGFWCVKRK